MEAPLAVFVEFKCFKKALSGCLCSGILGLVSQRFKGAFVVNSQFRQDLAVDLNIGQFQAVDESPVSQAMQSGSGVNALDPKRPEIAFFVATVAVCILSGLFHRLFGDADSILPAAPVALGFLQNFFVSGV
jgi:hypothetical protein